MPSDDELRRVAEDVRALARSLGRDLRVVMERFRQDVYGSSHREQGEDGGDSHTTWRSTRDDLAAAGRAARQELRHAQTALRQAARRRRGCSSPEGALDGDDGRDSVEWDGRPWDGGFGRHREDLGRRRASSRRHRRPGTGGPSGPGGYPGGGGLEGPPPGGLVSVAEPPAPPLRHRHDGSTLIGLLAVVFGLAWLAKTTNVARLSGEGVVAVALMVLGATMVVTARTDWALSRRGWPVVGGAALGVVLAAFAISPNFGGGFRHLQIGGLTVAPQSWDSLPSAVHGGVGHLVLDLTNLPNPAPSNRTLAVDNAAGAVDILVSPQLDVVVHATNVAGRIDVGGLRVNGVGRTLDQRLGPDSGSSSSGSGNSGGGSAAGSGAGVLTLNINTGLGEVNVTQATAGSGAGGPIKVVPSPAGAKGVPDVPAPPQDPGVKVVVP